MPYTYCKFIITSGNKSVMMLWLNIFYITRYSGILSAYGLALADVVHEAQEPCSKIYEGVYTSYGIWGFHILFSGKCLAMEIEIFVFPCDIISAEFTLFTFYHML